MFITVTINDAQDRDFAAIAAAAAADDDDNVIHFNVTLAELYVNLVPFWR